MRSRIFNSPCCEKDIRTVQREDQSLQMGTNAHRSMLTEERGIWRLRGLAKMESPARLKQGKHCYGHGRTRGRYRLRLRKRGVRHRPSNRTPFHSESPHDDLPQNCAQAIGLCDATSACQAVERLLISCFNKSQPSYLSHAPRRFGWTCRILRRQSLRCDCNAISAIKVAAKSTYYQCPHRRCQSDTRVGAVRQQCFNAPIRWNQQWVPGSDVK